MKNLHACYEKERSKKRRPQIKEQLKKANFHYLKSKRLVRRIKKMNAELNIISDESSIESSNDIENECENPNSTQIQH